MIPTLQNMSQPESVCIRRNVPVFIYIGSNKQIFWLEKRADIESNNVYQTSK